MLNLIFPGTDCGDLSVGARGGLPCMYPYRVLRRVLRVDGTDSNADRGRGQVRVWERVVLARSSWVGSRRVGSRRADMGFEEGWGLKRDV